MDTTKLLILSGHDLLYLSDHRIRLELHIDLPDVRILYESLEFLRAHRRHDDRRIRVHEHVLLWPRVHGGECC